MSGQKQDLSKFNYHAMSSLVVDQGKSSFSIHPSAKETYNSGKR
jgi:hypothetical protein